VLQLHAQRGAILDRNGHPLAMSVPAESVSVDPVKLPSLEFDSDLLAHQLRLEPAELRGRIEKADASHRQFLWVKRGITPQEADDIRNLKLDWTHLDDGSQRHYPDGTLAAHVLGGVYFQ
jgi:cell division protein FtsI (penicillin-binding protein 3)